MAKVWITYAWADNVDSQVEFIAQELGAAGLSVHMDRWDIAAGGRLWEQIERFIAETDCWIFVATAASLASQPCKEELAYALERALRTRDADFPVVGLFPGNVEMSLIPAAVRTRLFVSLEDPDWRERIRAAALRQTPAITRNEITPYFARLHSAQPGPTAVELRPRAGQWAPPFVGILSAEFSRVAPVVRLGAHGDPQNGSLMSTNVREWKTPDGLWWATSLGGPATPTMSLYLIVASMPSQIVFGASRPGGPEYRLEVAALK